MHEKAPDITGTVLIKVNFPPGIPGVVVAVAVAVVSLSRSEDERGSSSVVSFIRNPPRPSTALHLSSEDRHLHQRPVLRVCYVPSYRVLQFYFRNFTLRSR